MGARKALCKPRLALSETKLALLPGSTGSTGTKLSLPPGSAAHPVQNSPGTPQNADFGPLFARRENFLPLSPPTTRAGRTLSRMQSRFRYKTVPARGLGGRYRYETLPALLLLPEFREKVRPAQPLHQCFRTHARTGPSRANNFARQHPTTPQQRTPLQISHAIRLRELSTKPRNVAIPTIQIQSLKYPKGNCMRNWRGRIGERRGQGGLQDDAPSHTSATQRRRCGGRRSARSAWPQCRRSGRAKTEQNSHIISYGHFWRPSTNVAIATTSVHGLKYPQGNYVRN